MATNNSSLKTFTVDSLLGRINAEFESMFYKYDKQAEELIKQWVQECYELNIESASAWGMFFQMLMMKYSSVTIDLEYRRLMEEEKINQ